MSRIATSRRVALKAYKCDVCGGFIKSGAVYLRHYDPVEGVTSRECSRDATMFGRAGLLDKEKEKK